MHGSALADDLAKSLLGALQLHPRASWTRMAPIVGVDASTLSRRWTRLQGAGLMWVTVLPSASADWHLNPPHGSAALLRLRCAPGMRDAVAAQLIDDHRLWTVEGATGGQDLVAVGVFSSVRERDALVDRDLGAVPGVTDARVIPLRETIVSPAAWRTGTLPPSVHHAAAELSRIDARRTAARPPSRMELLVLHRLARDGRLGSAQIARSIHRSPTAVNGAIPVSVLGSGSADLHVDFAAEIFGWNARGTLLIQVPSTLIPDLSAALWRYPAHVHEAHALFGEANLAVNIWAREQWAIDIMEEMITTSFPEARVVDRWHTTRSYKRNGAVLDEDGCRTGFVDTFAAPAEAMNGAAS